MALPLVGFEEVGLVSVHEAVQVRRLDLGREREKPVSPVEGGVLVNTTAARTVSPSMRAWAYSAQHSRCCNRAHGVPVRGLKVLPQAAQRKRGKPRALPQRHRD
jgi:hypothetical protein